jgi:hypothetical protein
VLTLTLTLTLGVPTPRANQPLRPAAVHALPSAGRAATRETAPAAGGDADGSALLLQVAVDEVAEAKATFMAKHPEAFWAEFADFSVWRMDALLKARCVPMRSPPPQEHQGV